ncbi:hypothetical protein CAOG_04765 [Capsaspora owczarzaki ATCC 30864]|uniref:Uncharacterized protein n=1 Tax=Capsaspora owczarzaki (strain ATCC 30864) TaxID=595528 RepID=A0A0D2WQS1_CAPO3|nr:hypothetical protein CAOG_04765 [Capsaspora owczarzaki ATCC 30864]KJE94070.1 hypothetical protein CAOG_004765 [Capsaspora owczarzaki ATCC 30864]|eukprot:XP_004347516.2 hypothetical protein CAOG_04765 [Capsaspora owczarzaki ATCC 30864]
MVKTPIVAASSAASAQKRRATAPPAAAAAASKKARLEPAHHKHTPPAYPDDDDDDEEHDDEHVEKQAHNAAAFISEWNDDHEDEEEEENEEGEEEEDEEEGEDHDDDDDDEHSKSKAFPPEFHADDKVILAKLAQVFEADEQASVDTIDWEALKTDKLSASVIRARFTKLLSVIKARKPIKDNVFLLSVLFGWAVQQNKVSSEPLRIRGRRKKDAMEKDPNAPKRPPNGYALFVKRRRESLKQKRTDLSVQEIISLIAKEWKELPPAKKKEFERQAEALLVKYKADMEEYLAEHPEMAKVAKNRQKSERLPGEPHRPATAFIKFSEKHRAAVREQNPNVPYKDIARLLGERWKNLTEDQREKFKKSYENDVRKYQKELESFNAANPELVAQREAARKERKTSRASKGDGGDDGDSHRPKRPSRLTPEMTDLLERLPQVTGITPYLQFVKSTRETYLADHEGIKFSDLQKQLGEKWSSLNAREKAYWEDEVSAAKKSDESRRVAFLKSLSLHQKAVLEEAQRLQEEEKSLAKLQRKSREITKKLEAMHVADESTFGTAKSSISPAAAAAATAVAAPKKSSSSEEASASSHTDGSRHFWEVQEGKDWQKWDDASSKLVNSAYKKHKKAGGSAAVVSLSIKNVPVTIDFNRMTCSFKGRKQPCSIRRQRH